MRWPDNFFSLLANKGFRVIRFDNRDFGQSSRFEHLGKPNILAMMLLSKLNIHLQSRYTLQDMASGTIALLDYLKIEKVHFYNLWMSWGVT